MLLLPLLSKGCRKQKIEFAREGRRGVLELCNTTLPSFFLVYVEDVLQGKSEFPGLVHLYLPNERCYRRLACAIQHVNTVYCAVW